MKETIKNHPVKITLGSIVLSIVFVVSTTINISRKASLMDTALEKNIWQHDLIEKNVEAHEERIQTLEKTSTDIAWILAVLQVELHHIKESLEKIDDKLQ